MKNKIFKNLLFSILFLVSVSLLLAPILNTRAEDPDGTCTYHIPKGDKDEIKEEITKEADCGKKGTKIRWVVIKPPPATTAEPTKPEAQVETKTTPIENTNYILLEPLPCEQGTEGCELNKKTGRYELAEFNPSGTGKLGEYLNFAIKLFIGLCAVAAVVMIIIAGIQYSTSELISDKGAAKEKIQGAVLGLLLALGSWTILYTINPDLLNTDVDIGGTSLVSEGEMVVRDIDQPQIPVTKIVNGVARKVVKGTYDEGYVGQSWSGNKPALPHGVTLSRQECTQVGQRMCSSIKGLNLSYIKNIKSNCPNCEIIITEGTAYWLHKNTTSHGSGSATVDLRITRTLTTYITGGQSPVVGRRYERNGVSYLFEGNHWHVGP